MDRHESGGRGGLALLWDSTVDVTVRGYSVHHIDAEVYQSDGL